MTKRKWLDPKSKAAKRFAQTRRTSLMEVFVRGRWYVVSPGRGAPPC